MEKRQPKAQIIKVKSGRNKGQWRFKLRATNGEIIASSGSETYHNIDDLKDTVTKYFPNFVQEVKNN